jgi:catechol 2,3-dioxygenase-like lactoylglutathione lyase family enzyme
MSRVQLALNVGDVDAAVAFYSKLFGAEPAKRRPGYANFAIAEPPLKLVLIEGGGAPGTMNHLGVEVEDQSKVQAAIATFAAQEVRSDVEEGVTCCYAVQDKVWVTDPDGARWEVYTVLADADEMLPPASAASGDASCACEAPAAVAAGAGPAGATGSCC